MSFQRGHAQHCFPGFHASADGNTVAFDDQSTADGNITAYHWNFGDGQTSTEQDPSHTYAAPGTYHVCLVITAENPACTATFCHHVVVAHPPAGVCHAAFAAHQSNPAQQTIEFTDQSTSNGTVASWAWDFGDGQTSTEHNPAHTYAHPGNYLVCLTITDDGGCNSHICHHVVVHHPPASVCHAAFVTHQPDPNQQTFDFTDQSTSTGTIASWVWDFGDGQTSTEHNPVHTYAHPGNYLVCLTITDDGGCTSHVCHHVVVHHPVTNNCHAAFSVHHGASHSEFQFTNLSSGTANHTTYSWDFGDGTTSTETSPHHTYAHTGHYTVCLFMTDTITGCSSHICHGINVHHGGGHHYNPHHVKNDPSAAPKGEGTAERDNRTVVPVAIYPNPAVNTVYVAYQMQVAGAVKFEMYSVTGARVMALTVRSQPAGAHTEVIPVGNLVAGVYFLKMTVDGILQVHRISVQ